MIFMKTNLKLLFFLVLVIFVFSNCRSINRYYIIKRINKETVKNKGNLEIRVYNFGDYSDKLKIYINDSLISTSTPSEANLDRDRGYFIYLKILHYNTNLSKITLKTVLNDTLVQYHKKSINPQKLNIIKVYKGDKGVPFFK